MYAANGIDLTRINPPSSAQNQHDHGAGCPTHPMDIEMEKQAVSPIGASGCDVWTLARIAGHSNTRQSMRYVHPSEDTVFGAMERVGGHKTGHNAVGCRSAIVGPGIRPARSRHTHCHNFFGLRACPSETVPAGGSDGRSGIVPDVHCRLFQRGRTRLPGKCEGTSTNFTGNRELGERAKGFLHLFRLTISD